MTSELNDTFFIQHGKFYSAYNLKNNAPIPFKDHQQFPIIMDILSRKECHHALLCASFPQKLRISFLEGLLKYLTYEHIPIPLRDAELIYLDIENLIITKAMQKSIEKDIRSLCDALYVGKKYQLFALPSTKPLKSKKTDEFLRRQLKILITHPYCRFIIFTNHKEQPDQTTFSDQFSFLQITPPSELDIIMIIKHQRLEIENFHHVIIPEELLVHAYSLAERYLSAYDTLGNALLLLDSAAARASTSDVIDNQQHKPILTMNLLTSVLSSWTQIPESHLEINQFKISEFTQQMEQRVFGQDPAITIIGHELQQAKARLQLKSGPFCSFLFAGCIHSGKKTMALALVEQLFNQPNMLFYAQFARAPINLQSLIEIKLERSKDRQYAELGDVIRQKPYAVILFENIEHASPIIVDGLYEILTTGLLHDYNGNEFNFRQAIIILSTQLGGTRLNELSHSFAVNDEIEPVDLMQLVMNEKKLYDLSMHQHYSPQELVNEITPEIYSQLPQSLSRHVCLVPFLPLTKVSIEKIIHLKVKQLAKQLESRHGIELSYAPEVIRYLANEVLLKNNASTNTEKVIKQLYFCVEQAVLSQLDNKNRSNQLILQLNETGQLLRCDWLMMTSLRHHTI